MSANPSFHTVNPNSRPTSTSKQSNSRNKYKTNSKTLDYSNDNSLEKKITTIQADNYSKKPENKTNLKTNNLNKSKAKVNKADNKGELILRKEIQKLK